MASYKINFQGIIIAKQEKQQTCDKSTQTDIIDGKEINEKLMKNEELRLKSFANWPAKNIISPKNLAKFGFYYNGIEDEAKCVFCKGVLQRWEKGDIPLYEHLIHFPRCPFLIGYNVGNIPIGGDPIRDEKLLSFLDSTC